MSQSRGSSTETQALVQSMLQRLKLQAATEIQGGSLPGSPAAAGPRRNWGQNRDRAPHQQTLGPTSSPAPNGFGTALVDSPGTGTGRDVISNSCIDNTAGVSVDNVTGQPVTSSAKSGCQLPVNEQKAAKATSFAKTNDKMEGGKEGNYVIEERISHGVMRGAVTDDCNVHSSLAGNSTSASHYPSKSHSSNPEMTAKSGAVSQNGEHERGQFTLSCPGLLQSGLQLVLKGPKHRKW